MTLRILRECCLSRLLCKKLIVPVSSFAMTMDNDATVALMILLSMDSAVSRPMVVLEVLGNVILVVCQNV